MDGILAGGLAVAAALIAGTMAVVIHRSGLDHQAAIDRCLSAGGAWSRRGAPGVSGACLTRPRPDR